MCFGDLGTQAYADIKSHYVIVVGEELPRLRGRDAMEGYSPLRPKICRPRGFIVSYDTLDSFDRVLSGVIKELDIGQMYAVIAGY